MYCTFWSLVLAVLWTDKCTSACQLGWHSREGPCSSQHTPWPRSSASFVATASTWRATARGVVMGRMDTKNEGPRKGLLYFKCCYFGYLDIYIYIGCKSLCWGWASKWAAMMPLQNSWKAKTVKWPPWRFTVNRGFLQDSPKSDLKIQGGVIRSESDTRFEESSTFTWKIPASEWHWSLL